MKKINVLIGLLTFLLFLTIILTSLTIMAKAKSIKPSERNEFGVRSKYIDKQFSDALSVWTKK